MRIIGFIKLSEVNLVCFVKRKIKMKQQRQRHDEASKKMPNGGHFVADMAKFFNIENIQLT